MSDIRTNTMRSTGVWLFTITALCFVMTSSCPIKFNIKKLVGEPVSTEHGARKTAVLFSLNNQAACTEYGPMEISVVEGIVPATSYWFSLYPATPNTTPVLENPPIKQFKSYYRSHPQLLFLLPIYLQQQRLLI